MCNTQIWSHNENKKVQVLLLLEEAYPDWQQQDNCFSNILKLKLRF